MIRRIDLQTTWMAALAALVALAGCGGREAPPADTAETNSADPVSAAPAETDYEPADGGWLISHMPAEMEHLNPYTSHDVYSATIANLVFDRLLEMDNETFELKPFLAESWEVGEDNLSYTFRLRQDAAFSDGTPLTAEDVKFSFDTVKNPATDAPQLRNYYQDVAECQIIDAHTVKFICTRPYFRHLMMIGGLDIIPRHIYGEGDFNNHPRNRDPLGSGPYTLERWDTGQQLVLVRNESYWGKKPRIVRRIYKLITNDDAAFQVLQKGEMDVMNLRAEQWVGQASRPEFEARFNKFSYPGNGYSYIGWNLRKPMFADKRVRRALTMLLDRELIRDEIYQGLARVVSGSFHPDEPEYNTTIDPWPYDPDGAETLLAEAGWVDSNNNGTLDKDGIEFTFELLLTNDNPVAEQIATVFQESLRFAGVDMSIRQLEWATFLQSVKTHDFDASMLGWSLVPYPDPYQLWHSSQAIVDGSNAVGFVNEEADRIMEEARTVFDRDERVALYHRFHEILHEEQPYTFLFCREDLVTVDKRIHNTIVYPRGLDSLEWWVPLPLQKYK